MLKFRKLKKSDLAETDWEHAALTGLLPAPSYWADALSADAVLFVIFDGEKPIGMLEMDAKPTESRPACAKVNRVLILPELRRHGLGRMLMALAAGEAVERKLWFIAGSVPDTEEAQGFAAGIHLRKSDWFDDLFVLDLSDVEGLRHG